MSDLNIKDVEDILLEVEEENNVIKNSLLVDLSNSIDELIKERHRNGGSIFDIDSALVLKGKKFSKIDLLFLLDKKRIRFVVFEEFMIVNFGEKLFTDDELIKKYLELERISKLDNMYVEIFIAMVIGFILLIFPSFDKFLCGFLLLILMILCICIISNKVNSVELKHMLEKLDDVSR